MTTAGYQGLTEPLPIPTQSLVPTPATSTPELLALQSPPQAPISEAVSVGTNLLNIPPRMEDRLRNFPEEVYDTSPGSYLSRLIKVLIGDAGAGQLRKSSLNARLGSIIQGSNFYDLDGFYAPIFGLSRRTSIANPDFVINPNLNEAFPVNPYTDVTDADAWSSVRVLDARYRTRIDQLGKAISLGPSPIGMQLVAEAILQMPCYIYESWVTIDRAARTWADVEAIGTYTDLEAYTWLELETGSHSGNRSVFTIIPKVDITEQEAFNVQNVIDTLKPADMIVNVRRTGVDNPATPINLRGVAADSEYWTMVRSVIPADGTAQYYNLSPEVQPGGWREILRPSGTEYQGERISYNGSITGVLSYDGLVSGTGPLVIGTYTKLDGTTISYPPANGIAPRYFELAGKAVSDGILQAAPYSATAAHVPTATNQALTGIPTSTPATPPMALYVDGIALVALQDALAAAGDAGPFQVSNPNQRFWCTQNRLAADDTPEVLEIRMATKMLVNYLSFSVAHFPQTVQVQYQDPTNPSNWITVFNTGIYDSSPAILPIAGTTSTDNPQHSNPDSWVSFQAPIPPIELASLRVVCTRSTRGTPPVQQSLTITPPVGTSSPLVSTPIPYSLGVKDLALGYQIASKTDIPLQNIVTKDALGSAVSYTARYERANNAIIDWTDSAEPLPWRSEPMPSTESVVNFFIDTRDVAGNPQTVDRFFMAPLFLGPHCTIYASNTPTDGIDFEADITNLIPPVCTATGPNSFITVGGATGLAFSTIDPSHVSIDNTALQYNPSEPWWISILVQPRYPWFDPPEGGSVFWDLGNHLALVYLSNTTPDTPGVFSVFRTDTPLVSISAPENFAATGPPQSLTVAYFPESTDTFAAGLYLIWGNDSPGNWELVNLKGGITGPPVSPVFDFSAGNPNVGYASVNPGDMGFPPPEVLIGGSALYPDALSAFTLIGLCMKQTNFLIDDLTDWFDDYRSYTTINGVNSENSILRYDGSYIDPPLNFLGFVGGPGNFWSKLEWIPIARDFTLETGYYFIPPTLANYFKFEFTNLAAQPYETFIPITRTINTHQGIGPTRVQTTTTPALGNPGSTLTGSNYNQGSAPFLTFSDSVALQASTLLTPTPGSTPATAAMTALDPLAQAQLANNGWYWQFQHWSPSPIASRFVTTGKHIYTTYTVTQSSKVAFFVGLSVIQAYVQSFTDPDDEIIYDEFFHDRGNISCISPVLTWTPGDVNTNGVDDFDFCYIRSDNYVSTTPMAGVQFATIQTDARSIATNSTFTTDPSATTGSPPQWNNRHNGHVVGRLSESPARTFILVYLPTLKAVEVVVNTHTAAPLAPTFQGLVAEIVSPVFEDDENPDPFRTLTPFIGLDSSRPAREAPGWLGIEDLTSDEHGFSTAISYPGNREVVWAAVRITSATGLTTPLVLEIFDINSNTVVATEEVTCPAGQTVEAYVGYEMGSTVHSGPITGRIVQYGPATNSWIIESLALFDEGWKWDFSNDGGMTWHTAFGIRNNAFGALTFPEPSTNLMWRAVGNIPGMHINALRVRPIYDNSRADEPIGVVQGPNLSVFDHTPPIDQDPLFYQWDIPVPASWFRTNADYQTIQS